MTHFPLFRENKAMTLIILMRKSRKIIITEATNLYLASRNEYYLYFVNQDKTFILKFNTLFLIGKIIY